MKKGGRGGGRSKYYNRNDFTCTKPILINQPGGSAMPLIDKLSTGQVIKNVQIIKKANNDPFLIKQLKQKEIDEN